MKKYSVILAVLLAVSLPLLLMACSGGEKAGDGGDQQAGGNQQAASLEEQALASFKGKTISFVVPFKPGGGYDAYARMIAPFFEKNLPGSTVIVENNATGGGLDALNQLARAKADGSQILLAQATAAIINQLVGVPGIQYDAKNYTWLGRITGETYVLNVNGQSQYNTIEDMQNAKEITISRIGRDFSYLAAKIIAESLNIPNRGISGYESSSEMMMAVVRGEVDVIGTSYNSSKGLLQSGELKSIVQLGTERLKELPDLPTASEEAVRLKSSAEDITLLDSMANLMSVYRAVAAAPGTSPELAKVMRDAFAKAMQDPELLDAAQKAERPIEFMDGEQTQQAIIKAVDGFAGNQAGLDLAKEIFGTN